MRLNTVTVNFSQAATALLLILILVGVLPATLTWAFICIAVLASNFSVTWNV